MGASPNITLTATLMDCMGVVVGSTANPAKLCIALCGFGPQLPQVVGTSMLARVGPTYLEGPAGTFSTPVFGNDQITPDGTYYTVSLLDGQGNVVQSAAYRFLGSGSQDLSNAVPLLPPYGFPPQRLTVARCTGAIPGSVFTAPGATVVAVYYNGNLQRPTIDYTVFFSTITLNFTLEFGDSIYALCV